MKTAVPACGTTAAYQRHLLRAEVPCERCRLAYNSYMRIYRREYRLGVRRRSRPAGCVRGLGWPL